MSITDDIRRACAAVAARARFVAIDENAIEQYALALPLEKAVAPEVDWSRHYRGNETGTATFFVVLDAINFGSGYFPFLRKREGMSGYFTVASSLKDHFERNGVMSAEVLSQISSAECALIFNQDDKNATAMELMKLFAMALNDLGRLLLNNYQGQVQSLIESANRSAEKLIELLAEMPFYRDVSLYGGDPVPFYKRAQLTAADLSLALNGRGLGTFSDLNRLTIFADNLVPHVLRIDGISKYTDDLAARIDREELIEPGSIEEIEIRACALHAVDQMKEKLSRSGQTLSAMQLDYILWNRGQEKHYKSIKPRHRSRSVFY